MSTRREHPTDTTGAHRAHPVREPQRHADSARTAAGGAAIPDPRRSDPPGTQGPAFPMERYDPYLDGLFTYCLSVMCEHEAATAALGEGLALAERRHERGRVPEERGLYRPWLYALVRWACLRRLAERREEDGGSGGPAPPPGATGELSTAAANQRRRELAALAWPEAAGTAPEQREALELAVRHGLPAHEVASVLSLAPDAASALLANAACEVERTRAALAVVKSGGCPAVARLAGDDHLLLGTALRRELVRHVDECPECRRAAERAMAGVGWPGTAPAGTAQLAVLEAPRPAVLAAVAAVRRARAQHSPRFAKSGFPAQVKDREARRDRLRSRAVTTTVVATVLAAPVLALWAAYRGAPLTGEPDGASVTATEHDARKGLEGEPYEQAAQHSTPAGGGPTDDGRRTGSGEPGHGPGHRHGGARGGEEGHRSPSGSPGGGDRAGAPRLTVDARPDGDSTLITLRASGDGDRPVRWSASPDAEWLRLSRTSGELRPGGTTTVRVTVDHAKEPAGDWSARVRIAPSGAVVTLEGRGASTPTPTPTPSEPTTPPPSQDPTPSDPPSSSPPPSTGSPAPEPTDSGSPSGG
ncbi:sigma-70 family RNA polymerase sigma factor [Streptomyces sp. ODS28]|uniref:sigma-70 family RNA polymerase sigma factor n=1 Tax=Streptomyces sp. ODS28 TaxID=3136688 RepID=UPI0031E56B25